MKKTLLNVERFEERIVLDACQWIATVPVTGETYANFNDTANWARGTVANRTTDTIEIMPGTVSIKASGAVEVQSITIPDEWNNYFIGTQLYLKAATTLNDINFDLNKLSSTGTLTIKDDVVMTPWQIGSLFISEIVNVENDFRMDLDTWWSKTTTLKNGADVLTARTNNVLINDTEFKIDNGSSTVEIPKVKNSGSIVAKVNGHSLTFEGYVEDFFGIDGTIKVGAGSSVNVQGTGTLGASTPLLGWGYSVRGNKVELDASANLAVASGLLMPATVTVMTNGTATIDGDVDFYLGAINLTGGIRNLNITGSAYFSNTSINTRINFDTDALGKVMVDGAALVAAQQNTLTVEKTGAMHEGSWIWLTADGGIQDDLIAGPPSGFDYEDYDWDTATLYIWDDGDYEDDGPGDHTHGG